MRGLVVSCALHVRQSTREVHPPPNQLPLPPVCPRPQTSSSYLVLSMKHPTAKPGMHWPRTSRLAVPVPSPTLGSGGRVSRVCANPTCAKSFLTATSQSRRVFGGMSVLCSAACASKFSGRKVVAVRRPEPVESKRPQASYQRARRALSGAFTQVKRLGYTSFAAVASAPGGRTVQQVRVGTTEDGRPDTAGAMLAILAAVFADPQRLVKKLDARKAEREAKALEEGGAAEIVRKVPASVLAAFEVRVYAVSFVSSASPLPSSPHVAPPPRVFPTHFPPQTTDGNRGAEARGEDGGGPGCGPCARA